MVAFLVPLGIQAAVRAAPFAARFAKPEANLPQKQTVLIATEVNEIRSLVPSNVKQPPLSELKEGSLSNVP